MTAFGSADLANLLDGGVVELRKVELDPAVAVFLDVRVARLDNLDDLVVTM